MASQSAQTAASGNLVDLVSSSGSATVYPSDDAVLSVLQARFRADLPYTRVGDASLVVVNPYKTLANVNDVSAQEYEERCYKDASLPMADSPKPLQPHPYELAARMYLLMRRRNEAHAVVARGITASGKSTALRLCLNQILRISAHSRREIKVADQIKAFYTLLDSFGNAKTLLNPNASRHGRYLELHFNERGRISSAKVLTFGLDKSRLSRLSNEERSYHVFYQFLAGATPAERDTYNLEDPSDYALLASSGCYRLPAGPFSDDSIAMDELRAAMKTLGFKPKHVSSIFALLAAILLLGNIQFGEGDARDVSAYVTNAPVLDQVARILGVAPDDLGQTLTNKTNYVKKELYTVLLSAEQSAAQRNQFVRDMYAILFAFVAETANHRLAPSTKDPSPHQQIVLFDLPGFQSRGPAGTNSMALTGTAPLVSAYGQSGFEEFCINFGEELLHSYVLRNTFEDSIGYNGQATSDGVSLPAISTMDNLGCIELLRGSSLSERGSRKPGGMLGIIGKSCAAYKSGKGGERRNEDLLQDLNVRFGVHASYVASTESGNQSLFGINHYAGNCSYDTSSFVEKDTDMLDSALVTLLRSSSDSFVSKLFSGPSMAVEKHSKDDSIVVQAQVSSRPLRQPTPLALPSGSQQTADDHPQLDISKVYPVTTQLNFTLSEIFASLDRTRLWTVSCIRPNDSGSPNSFDKRRVKAQIRSLLLPDIVARRSAEYIVDFDQAHFCDRYVPTMRGSEAERIRQCAAANGWRYGEDYVVGHRMIWLMFSAWKMVEDVLRTAEKEQKKTSLEGEEDDEAPLPDDTTEYTHAELAPQGGYFNESVDNLLLTRTGTDGTHYLDPNSAGTPYGAGVGNQSAHGFSESGEGGWGSDYDKKPTSPGNSPLVASKEAGGIVVNPAPQAVEEVPSSGTRRVWLWLVWMVTGFIPTIFLKTIGRMKRPDIRIAWREKVTIFFLIFLLNCTIIFYIVEFGRLLCPNFDKAWSVREVGLHTGQNDFWVAIQGSVYDISSFIHGDHSDISGVPSNGADTLEFVAGQDLTGYFPPPLVLACQNLVTNPQVSLVYKNFTALVPTAMHTSGALQSIPHTKLDNPSWYTQVFQPSIAQFYKGPLVWKRSEILSQSLDANATRTWAIWDNGVYDLTDYLNSISVNKGATALYSFLDDDIVHLFMSQAGQDITKQMTNLLATKSSSVATSNTDCLKHAFYIGRADFRDTPRCLVQNYLLLVFSIVLVTSMALKFLAALQLTGKRSPELLDKFVICQVPCYTEGEDSLRRTIDSIAGLNYDDKRKLLFIICDGNIIGSGNDRTTPRIVLDILGVDPKLDPEPLLFKSVGEGSRALNYGKVYSGLYEFEGHVVPYMVIVKVGKPSERSKPGNRGKRDSQIMMMHYLNRVHFDSPMNPLELEIYHQMRNVIGIDPAFYEYIFTVDADTSVNSDSLNRLVASAADDSSIIGICGETKLENEEGSWWTMIQVYEYYISHHLSKAFESLFGSVTCLPGCFSLYRIRTADKGRPIIISNRIIDEYAEPNVDTLHKKNLLSLGEDRYLTTLLMKHFPTFRTKFIPDAIAHTMAPESWRVLFSQRRRWINSTVHNLCELVFLPELFGFCCFSMRFFVFIDLLGTLILPATVVYLAYLIGTVATRNAAFPRISIIMLGATYGLQAIIFILKREFMLVGWMIVYILSYPVYSFFLPVYAFWCMDDFTWGNTRLVIGEGGSKKVVMNDDEKFDESMIPLKKFSEYEAEAWDGSHHSDETHNTGYESKSHSRRQPPSLPESPRSYHQASQSGDYYRDTNLTNNGKPNARLGGQLPHSNLSQQSLPHAPPPMSQYGVPQLPLMPFNADAGSYAGSEYGRVAQLPMPPMGLVPTASMYGMPGGPRNTVMSGMNPYMGSGVSHAGSMQGGPPMALQGRPMSTFSLATTAGPAAGPSLNPNPSDDELFIALRNYLSTQDLMTVTKKTAREAMTARFPKADLTSRKDFLNKSIDTILSAP